MQSKPEPNGGDQSFAAAAAAAQVPTFEELQWPALIALKVMGGSASNDELLAKVIEVTGVSDEIASVVHSDHRQTKLSYNLAWAKTYLKRAGAVENSARGVWSITDAGERVTQVEAKLIPATVRRQDYERRREDGIQSQIDQGRENQQAGSEEIGELPEQHWKDLLLSTLQQMQPDAFERLAQRLLREAGFTSVEVTGRVGDGGIDGVGILRSNLLLSFRTLFQCKRYVGTVGSGAVRDFRGAMVGRSDKGLIITTGTFSADARREAARDGAPAIDLIDGDYLCDLLKQLSLGVTTELIERVVVDKAWIESV